MAQQKKTVLMIEDDVLLARMYEIKLEMAGYDVLLAHSAGDVSALLGNCDPSVILLDILLPKVNGLAVLKELRKHPTTMHCPVIILTNLAGSEIDMDDELADALGVVAYLVKSKVTPDKVLEQVNKAVATGR